MLKIAKTSCNFEREALRAAFGFKGRTVSELWQAVARIDDRDGRSGLGLGTQSVLWSDAAVFERYGETAGNALMFQLTAYALRECEGGTFSDPVALLDHLLPKVLAYGNTLLGGRGQLRPTFGLNALVAVDNAAWQLHAVSRGIKSFDDLIPTDCREALSERHHTVGNIPLLSFGTTVEEAVEAARRGHYVLKIKIGSDPGKNGNQEQMFQWDCNRISELHTALRDFTSSETSHGRIAYYLDANGRYDSLERVQRLLDHCQSIGAFEQILLLEEPFPEESDYDVSSLPIRVVADESAHSLADVNRRIDAGYGAIALKPIAKTLSLSFQMAAAAHRRGVPCFCADLTVNPILVDWNKNFAARLVPLPGIKSGVFEANGSQNYRDWKRLQSYHSMPEASWCEPSQGQFSLDDSFYNAAGAILVPSAHYRSLVS